MRRAAFLCSTIALSVLFVSPRALAQRKTYDVVVERGESDRAARVVVIDKDGERVQVFTLEGRSYGAFAEGA